MRGCGGPLVSGAVEGSFGGVEFAEEVSLWTSKVKGQTLCVALSKAQHHLLAKAIENNRRLQKTLERMQAFTLKTILKKVPGVRKLK